MDEVSLWYWIVLFIQIATPSSIIISSIIWFKNKNTTNKWVKVLYWVRFSIGILFITLIIKDFAFGVLDLHSGFGIGVFVSRFIMAWLLMRRWVKAKPPEDTPMPEQIISEAV